MEDMWPKLLRQQITVAPTALYESLSRTQQQRCTPTLKTCMRKMVTKIHLNLSLLETQDVYTTNEKMSTTHSISFRIVNHWPLSGLLLSLFLAMGRVLWKNCEILSWCGRMNPWAVRSRDLLIDSRPGTLRDLSFAERGLFLPCETPPGSASCTPAPSTIYPCTGDTRTESAPASEEVGCFRGLWDSRVISGEPDRHPWRGRQSDISCRCIQHPPSTLWHSCSRPS